MKICLVTNLYTPLARGGAEKIVALEAEALVLQGNDVSVITTVPEGSELRREELINGVKVFRFTPPNLFFYTEAHTKPFGARLGWHFIDMWNKKAVDIVGDLLRKIDPDVVHTHNLMGVGFMLPSLLRRWQTPHVHTLHDVQLLHPSGLITVGSPTPTFAVRFARSRYIGMMKRLMGTPRVVLSPSAFLLDLHWGRGFFKRSKRVVLHNPMSAPQAQRESRAGDKVRFLFVGQLEEHKGILDILDAWEAQDGFDGAVLDIAGTGTLEKHIRERAGKMPSIAMHGRVEGDDLHKLYASADFTVMASTVIENAPTVIGESYSHGTPVIAPALGGIPEFVTEGETGYLYSPGSESLSSAMMRAKDGVGTWVEMSEAARGRANEQSLRHHRDELLNAYELAISRKK